MYIVYTTVLTMYVYKCIYAFTIYIYKLFIYTHYSAVRKDEIIIFHYMNGTGEYHAE